MSLLILPLHLLLLIFASWVNRRQLDVIDYLQEENRALKERLNPGHAGHTFAMVPRTGQLRTRRGSFTGRAFRSVLPLLAARLGFRAEQGGLTLFLTHALITPQNDRSTCSSQ